MEYDNGDVIEGYLIPDGFSDVSSIIVTREDGSKLELKCDQARPAVVQAGRHETGMVGFRLDQNCVPGLHAGEYLAIHDKKTGLLIYRRPPVPQPVQLKLIRLELNMLPMMHFDQFFGQLFQYSVPLVERFGHETTLQAFHINAMTSVYISGRLLFRNYEDFLDRGYKAFVEVPNPFYEMACRIFMLKRLSRGPVAFIGERDRLILNAGVEHFANVNIEDQDSVKRALKKAPDKVKNILASPVTRQLVCTYPEQRVTRRDVASAIGMLSRFVIVGHSDIGEHFQHAVGELLSVPPMEIPIMPQHSILKEFAARLKEIPAAETMLEEDLILDYYIRHAVSLT